MVHFHRKTAFTNVSCKSILMIMDLYILEIFTNSVDPDEMTLNVAFHQILTCLI